MQDCRDVNLQDRKTRSCQSPHGCPGHLHWQVIQYRSFNPLDKGKKLEDICPSTHNMEVPNVKRKDFQLIGVNDDFLSLMDDTGDMREDLKCPEDAIGEEIKAAIDKDADILVRSR